MAVDGSPLATWTHSPSPNPPAASPVPSRSQVPWDPVVVFPAATVNDRPSALIVTALTPAEPWAGNVIVVAPTATFWVSSPNQTPFTWVPALSTPNWVRSMTAMNCARRSPGTVWNASAPRTGG